MQTIKALINKIKWDEKEDMRDYTLIYRDFEHEREIPYTAIIRLEGNFMVLKRGDEDVEIPLHRIRKVKKKDKIIWKR